MPEMVCGKCKTELKIETTGVYVVEYFNDPPQPYKIWQADQWMCPNCEYDIVAGFGLDPIAVHHEPEFEECLKKLRDNPAVVVVKDYEFKRGHVCL